MTVHRRIVDRLNVSDVDAWVAYSPTWSNVTLGNAVQSFVYAVVDDGVRVRGFLRRGSSTSFTGTVSLSAPPGVVSSDTVSLGHVLVLDSGTRLFVGTCVVSAGSNTITPFVADGAGYVVNASSPMTWGANDELRIDITIGTSP